MFNLLDRFLDQNWTLDRIEAVGDWIPPLHAPRSHRPTAGVLVLASAVLAAIAGRSPLDAATAAAAMIPYTPGDRTVTRWADGMARWWAAVLDRRLPRMAARVRRKNGVAIA